ncbi:CotS family spore coat protein [Clostridium estertheticum]|uniref:CotS family spore coat protein n=1 Tax=Clostridium estertheticum TaxID=238834 RepID=A0AA47I823_9CLOT|nr:CotS family spore coat protein [Clostridium estertheticum]MBU3153586.1 CotS family spore coat protein [Clostridium estertheticum]MBU3200680.1 CotS family spore coat protein [Clostridium estertheticum]WAG60984.1 CotS family spore coat protein [Clostridium estertheticum]WAG64861.1 CotS family spore coat protein [Clostridium estertheticum]
MPSMAKNFNNINLLSEENVKKNILPQYDLANADISQIKFKDTDKQRAVYKVQYFDECYCLKKVYYSIKDLLFVYSAIEWLYRNNIHVPRILKTKNNSRFVNYNNMLFILTPWINGIKCDYDNIDHILVCSTNLANMHKVSINFKPICGSSLKEDYSPLGPSIYKHYESLLNFSNLAYKYDDAFSKLYLKYFETSSILAKCSSNIAYSLNLNNLTKSLCHLDYVNKNIIFDTNNEIWVIDFDKCRNDYCAHDISYSLRRLLKRDSTKWDLELAISFLDLYDKILPLTLDDYKYILVYLAFPQRYWKISRDYYGNINKCNKKAFLNLLNNATNKNDYQLDFVQKFKSYIENKFSMTHKL